MLEVSSRSTLSWRPSVCRWGWCTSRSS